MHPDFAEIVDVVTQLRDMFYPDAKTCILSNSTTLQNSGCLSGLGRLDKRMMKLDVGSATLFEQVNRPADGILFERVIEGLRRIESYILQTNLFEGAVSNAGRSSIDDWLNKVAVVRPSEIALYTVCRPTTESGIKPVDSNKLAEIALLTERELGIHTHAYTRNS
jgi:wyosine [tRNA(Phe)-imidazoG37] synthetase (radical SAM superfamily)